MDVAAYYFPGFHADSRSEAWHGAGWTEWELLKRAEPRYAGHYQPRVPEWGHFDEADPHWAARQARLAREHGITAFLFDWYWYDGPFLNRALDEGFLKAGAAELKFALHWCNHDWQNVQPRLSVGEPQTLLEGACSATQFDVLADHVIEHYLCHPSYLWIGGAPYFSIYQIGTFIKGLGSMSEAARALERFRDRARLKGLPGVHINVVLTDVPLLHGDEDSIEPASLVRELRADSVGSYAWMHHYDLARRSFPTESYTDAAEANFVAWEAHRAEFSVPYYPNVTVGWDSSPRTCQSDTFLARDYPWLAVLEGDTASAYESALRRARDFAAAGDGSQLVTINAWNEWTEGSYLLPDLRRGSAHLDATRRVFGDLAPLAVALDAAPEQVAPTVVGQIPPAVVGQIPPAELEQVAPAEEVDLPN